MSVELASKSNYDVPFLDMGLRSSEAVSIIDALNFALNIDLPVVQLFETPTTHLLAAHVFEKASGVSVPEIRAAIGKEITKHTSHHETVVDSLPLCINRGSDYLPRLFFVYDGTESGTG